MPIDIWQSPTWLLAGLITIYVAVYYLSIRPRDVREPPIIRSKIPYLGHLLGMVFHGGRYVKTIGLRKPQSSPWSCPTRASTS